MTHASQNSRGRRALSLAGEVLVTLGVVFLLFIVWQNWWTDISSRAAFAEGRTSVANDWGATLGPDGIPGPARPAPVPSPSGPTQQGGGHKGGTSHAKKIKTIGLMFVPALKKHDLWGQPIVEGTSSRALNKGVGHYPGTAAAGGIGNMAIAGHRTTHGAPFRHLDSLRRGDRVIIRMKDTWYIYKLDKSKVVRPHENWVLRSRPWRGALGRLLTLTTCHPPGSAGHRLVWWGHLVRTQSARGVAPRELKLTR